MLSAFFLNCPFITINMFEFEFGIPILSQLLTLFGFDSCHLLSVKGKKTAVD